MMYDDDAPAMPDDLHKITLQDVFVHMQYGFQRLEGEIKSNTAGIESNRKAIEANRKAIEANKGAIDLLRVTLTKRMNSLEEDLIATMQDTVHIRRKVGMPVPED